MKENTKDFAKMLKVLSLDKRLQILLYLKGGSLCVNALAARLEVTQGAVSQHLRIMRDAGLVTAEKTGYYVHYRLNEKAVGELLSGVLDLLSPGPCAGRECVKKRPGKNICR